MNTSYSTDIVIFGSGIAGLWLLSRLRSEGYDPILFETNTIGGKQTVASQGIIHGGLKYALSGKVTRASNTIAEMPSRWRRCLEGKGEVDLTDVRILSENYYMWSDGGMRSKLKNFLGSRALTGKVYRINKAEYPEFFKLSTVAGSLYRLKDFVIDTESLVGKLISDCRDRIFAINEDSLRFFNSETTGKQSLEIKLGNKNIILNAEKFIFSAGEGNKHLIKLASLRSIDSQIRPLHMTYLSKNTLPEVYAHCVGNDFSLTPKLTVSTHKNSAGDSVWYLGGYIAETGNKRSQAEQITIARRTLKEFFPWIDFSNADWNSFFINRAEAKTENNSRPNNAVVAEEQNILVTWPTKLTLTPYLADKVLESLEFSNVNISCNTSFLCDIQALFSEPEITKAYWN